MRAVARYQSDDSLRLNLHEYSPNTVENTMTTGIGQVSQSRREDVLRQAAMVGVEYLAAHKQYGLLDDAVEGTGEEVGVN